MSKRYLLVLTMVAIAANLSSCNSTPTSTSSTAPTTSPTPTPNPSMAQLRAKATNPTTTVTVTLYTSDTQCQELIPQKVALPTAAPMTSAVGKILEERDSADFSFSGYRVSVQNGVATVDLRLSPQSQRQIASLSSCEQFALFGSLRKTLTSNKQWQIKDVRFTEKGEEIVL